MGKSAYFHHVSILSGSKGMLHDCEAYYARNFGMHVVKPAGESPEEEYSFLADNAGSGGAPLEIIGEPWEKREHEFHQRHGSGVDHVAFIVEDTDLAVRDLQAAGVHFHIPPYDFLETRIAWCKDPSGVDVEIMQAMDADRDLEANPRGAIRAAQFNHAGILTGSRNMAAATEAFYRDHFDMRVIHRGDPSNPALDWVYLEDASGENPFWLEVVGPALWEEEKRFLEQHGPGLDHLCFVVGDVDAHYRWLAASGAQLESEIIDYDGSRMFYLRGPAGTSIQVIQMQSPGNRWAHAGRD
jgi:catechol 2,3-dioxygenase-like lactoylglutathione lyase family enzyme